MVMSIINIFIIKLNRIKWMNDDILLTNTDDILSHIDSLIIYQSKENLLYSQFL